ncbi:hypothetical protein F5B21DRAFT_481725 [Xylaria acuta]|nr:hypothetical protein F5B21DRAFT_481725 [Xylaria acuta]
MASSVALIISFLGALAVGAPVDRQNMTVYMNAMPSTFNITMVEDVFEPAPRWSLSTNQLAGIISGALLAFIPLGFLVWCVLICLGCIGRRSRQSLL